MDDYFPMASKKRQEKMVHYYCVEEQHVVLHDVVPVSGN